MKNLIISIVGILLVVSTSYLTKLHIQKNVSLNSHSSSNRNANRTEGDVALHQNRISFFGGVFKFDCGDGEISAVYDVSSEEIIPLGASIVAVRSDYVIGAYDGKITVGNNGINNSYAGKIFYVLMKNGDVKYYYPSDADSNFIGVEISNLIYFD